MSIVENASATFGRKLGPLPVGAWAAIGIGTVVVVKLLRGGSGGGGGTVTVPDAFAGDASDSSSGGGGGGVDGGSTIPTPTTPVGGGTTAGAPAKYRLSLIGRTQFYSTVGKLVDVFGESGTYDATIVKVGTKSYYRIKRGGVWRLIPVGSKTVKVTQT